MRNPIFFCNNSYMILLLVFFQQYLVVTSKNTYAANKGLNNNNLQTLFVLQSLLITIRKCQFIYFNTMNLNHRQTKENVYQILSVRNLGPSQRVSQNEHIAQKALVKTQLKKTKTIITRRHVAMRRHFPRSQA